MQPIYDVTKAFSDACHGHENIPLAIEEPLAHRLVGCIFGLKTALFHLKYQGNWVHKIGCVLYFHMRYSSLPYGKKMTGWQFKMLRVLG